MDHARVSTVLFLCDVKDRCANSPLRMAELRVFVDEVTKHKAKRIKDSTLIRKGTSFLAQFPDLRLRFWRIMADPRGGGRDKPTTTTITGKFAPLGSDVISGHVLQTLSYPTAGRLATTCKWLRNMITPRLLVDLRHSYETLRLCAPVMGGSAPLRLVTVDGQPMGLHIVCSRLGLMFMEHKGRHYALESPSFNTRDYLWHRRLTWRTSTDAELTLFGLLRAIGDAPPEEIPDFYVWAKLKFDDEASVSIDVCAYGGFDLLTRTHEGEGVKHWFSARGFRVNWGPV
jgi:hypothetical protein